MVEGWGILDGTTAGGTAFSDNFNRTGALGSPWNHTCYDLVNHTTTTDYWACDGSNAYITTQVVISFTGMPQFAWITDTTADGTITLTISDAVSQPDFLGACFGVDSSTGSVWRATGQNLSYMTGWSNVLTYSYSSNFANGDVMTVVLSGQDITVKKNGTAVTTQTGVRTSARGLTTANAGMYGHFANAKLDDFSWAPASGAVESWD